MKDSSPTPLIDKMSRGSQKTFGLLEEIVKPVMERNPKGGSADQSDVYEQANDLLYEVAKHLAGGGTLEDLKFQIYSSNFIDFPPIINQFTNCELLAALTPRRLQGNFDDGQQLRSTVPGLAILMEIQVNTNVSFLSPRRIDYSYYLVGAKTK